MIVDEIAGRCEWFRRAADKAHIIRVPYPVFPFDDSDGTPGLMWTEDRIPEGMVPMEKGGAVISDFCRAPYPAIILASESNERGCQYVLSTSAAQLGAVAGIGPPKGIPPETPTFLSLLIGFETEDKSELDCRPAVCFATTGKMSFSPADAELRDAADQPDNFSTERLLTIYRDRMRAMWVWSSIVSTNKSKTGGMLQEGMLAIEEMSASRPVLLDYIRQASIDVAHIALTTTCAFTLLNTRNVVQEEVAPSPQLQKKRAKTGKLPLYRYHVLKVKLFDVRRAHGKPTGFGHAQAIHWRRGHFKTYTAERPLLGRHVGRWWWQPNVVGTDDRVVEKSYAIEGGRK